MWEKVIGLFKFVFTVTEEIKRLQADSKDFDQQLRHLAENQARLYYEFQLQRERDAREREQLEHERERFALETKANSLERENERLRRLLEKVNENLASNCLRIFAANYPGYLGY